MFAAADIILRRLIIVFKSRREQSGGKLRTENVENHPRICNPIEILFINTGIDILPVEAGADGFGMGVQAFRIGKGGNRCAGFFESFFGVGNN